MTRLLLVLSTFVFTTFYATASAQSHTFNGRRVSVPTTTASAANVTANSSARISNLTESSFDALGGDEDTDDEDSDNKDSDNKESDNKHSSYQSGHATGTTDSDDNGSSDYGDDPSDSSLRKDQPSFGNVLTATNTTNKKILQMLYQTDNVAFDIPVTIAACLGMKVDDQFKFADRAMNTAELVLKEVINNGRAIFSDWTAFTRFMGRIALGDMIRSLNESDITSLKTALESNSTCGYDTKRLLDRMWMTVAEMRRQNPTISENNIRGNLQLSVKLNVS
ncbi:unnamed protein product [Peronospora destructor]|uniref:Uncharacterized protein n=1 Tax=Peronospora destructor TaxID=86335 RepID=A0AAV0T0X6_9STRA|nr:unnamed protein product [Peronospora destructor]